MDVFFKRFNLALLGFVICTVGPAPEKCFGLGETSFDVEIVSPTPQTQRAFRVGDELQLRIKSLIIPGAQDYGKELKLQSHDQDQSQIQEKQEDWVFRMTPIFKSNNPLFTIVLVKPGKVTLPSLVIQESDSGESIGRTNPLTLDVESAIAPNDPQPDQLEKNEPPIGLAFPKRVMIITSLFVLLLLGGLVLGIILWKKRKSPGKKEVPVPVLPEDELALQELDKLLQANLMGEGRLKAHYFGISDIIKAYLGARYQFNALESTTQEVLDSLKRTQERTQLLSEDGVVDELRYLFEKLDLVKFTDSIPTIEEPSQLIQEARAFVKKTRRQPSHSILTTTEVSGAHQHAVR